MPNDSPAGTTARALPDVPRLMAGKRGLVMGVANNHSIAWGIAQALHGAGAELAFTYQGGAFGKRVLPMVEKLGSKIVEEVDVENEQSLQTLFARLQWRNGGALDTSRFRSMRSPTRRVEETVTSTPSRRQLPAQPDHLLLLASPEIPHGWRCR